MERERADATVPLMPVSLGVFLFYKFSLPTLGLEDGDFSANAYRTKNYSFSIDLYKPHDYGGSWCLDLHAWEARAGRL